MEVLRFIIPLVFAWLVYWAISPNKRERKETEEKKKFSYSRSDGRCPYNGGWRD